jgi:hypothetical protein
MSRMVIYENNSSLFLTNLLMCCQQGWQLSMNSDIEESSFVGTMYRKDDFWSLSLLLLEQGTEKTIFGQWKVEFGH